MRLANDDSTLMTRLWALALLSVLLAAVAPALSEPRFSFETTPCCLPKDVRPTAYRLDLKLNLEKLASADGKEDVEAKRKWISKRLGRRTRSLSTPSTSRSGTLRLMG
jgi:hypothetical protein